MTVAPLPRRQVVAFLGFSVAIGVFSAFNNYTLSLWLTGFTTSYVLIGLLGNTKSVEGAVVSPLTGVLSDRTWLGWLGRRRPFILFGGLSSALLLALTPTIARLPLPGWLGWLDPETARLVVVVLPIILFTLTFNTGDDVHKALLGDLADGAARNRLSSFSVVADIGAQFLLLGLGFFISRDGVPDAAFLVAAAVVAAGVLVTVLGVREPPPRVWAAARAPDPVEGERPSLGTILREYRPALTFCGAVFAYWSGVNAIIPLLSIFTRDILRADAGEAQLLPGLLLLSTACMAVPMAWLGSRFGKQRLLGVGYATMGIAAVVALLISTKEQGALVFALAGLGNAAIVTLAVPFMADLVPRRHLGFATGAMAASGSVAAPLASVVAGSLAGVFGPRAIFAVMAVMTCVALALLSQVRPPRPHAVPVPEPAPAGQPA